MKYDLEGLFGQLVSKIPTAVPGDEVFVFSSQTLPRPRTYLRTSRLLIRKGMRYYNSSFRYDWLLFQAEKETYRDLGLLILASVFHSKPSNVYLSLTHPYSEIRNLILRHDFEFDEMIPGYSTRPYRFGYLPSDTKRNPWSDLRPDPVDLPCFYLTNRKDMVVTEDDWKNRDTVIGLGSDQGSVLFAELLLNASRPHNAVNEYVLEGELGVRGVGPGSSELTLFLPGSLGWEPVTTPVEGVALR